MKNYLKREAIEEYLESFRSRAGEARGFFARALSSVFFNLNLDKERKVGLLENMDFSDLLGEEHIVLHRGLKALLNMDELTYSLLRQAMGEVEEVEVIDGHIIEAELYFYTGLLTDLLEEARIAAAGGKLPICGQWAGGDTVVAVQDFFAWAECEDLFVPDAIRHAIEGPKVFARRRRGEGASDEQVAYEMSKKYPALALWEIGDILRPGDRNQNEQRVWARRKIDKWKKDAQCS